MKTTTKIAAAFANLRRQGFWALQNYECCQGCAGYAVATRASEAKDAGKRLPQGVIFFTKQDGAGPSARVARCGGGREWRLMIAYGDVDTQKHGRIGLPTAEVGHALVAALREVGLEPTWDGDPNTRISVRYEDAFDRHVPRQAPAVEACGAARCA